MNTTMHRERRRTLILLVVGQFFLAADGGPSFHKVWTVPPGRFAEVNLEVPQAGAFQARFSASAPLEWDIHSHPAPKTVVIHENGNADAGTIEFRAPAGGKFSVLWMNKTNAPVQLTVSLDGDAVVHSIAPRESWFRLPSSCR
jgi:hypothetical protein